MNVNGMGVTISDNQQGDALLRNTTEADTVGNTPNKSAGSIKPALSFYDIYCQSLKKWATSLEL
jgi:hypothetical protein